MDHRKTPFFFHQGAGTGCRWGPDAQNAGAAFFFWGHFSMGGKNIGHHRASQLMKMWEIVTNH